MARRSRMGSDPLSNKPTKDSRKKKDEASSVEGLDALIRDTRKSADALKGEKKTKAKGKPSSGNIAAAGKKKATAREKIPAPPEKPSQVKMKKKPVPDTNPGVLIDLELPHDGEPTPAPGTVHDLAPQAEDKTPKEAAPEATEKKAKTAPGQEKKKTPEKSAIATQDKAEQSTPAPAKEKTSQKSRPGKLGKLGKSGKLLDEQADMDQFLAFRLGEESFAFEIERVREVLSFTKVTKVPNTPDFMIGVINLRGNVVPVVDLRLLFGLGQGEMTEDTCIIIVEVALDDETLEIGARADAVREVFDLKKDNIEPAPTLGKHLDTEFMLGMGKKDDEFLLLLDIEKVFSMENLAQR